MDRVIAKAAQTPNSTTALQESIDGIYRRDVSDFKPSGSTLQLFWYKGVLYLVRMFDAPDNVMEGFKAKNNDLWREARSVKIGHSMEDLIGHEKKMKNLLTYLAGAKLCHWNSIWVFPFTHVGTGSALQRSRISPIRRVA